MAGRSLGRGSLEHKDVGKRLVVPRGGLVSTEPAILSSRTAAALHRASGDAGKCPETHFGDDQVDRPAETWW
jgi:hypothetical protein